MAFFSDVHSGQKVQHSAIQENAIRHLLNGGGGFGDGAKGKSGRNSLRVCVYNASSTVLPAGCGVQYQSSFPTSEPFPVGLVTDTSKSYGVLCQHLDVGQVGDMVVNGVATLSNAVFGTHAQPNGTGWVGADSGLVVINQGNSTCLAIVGSGSGSSHRASTNAISYNGYSWSVSAGYIRIGTAMIWHGDASGINGNSLFACAWYENGAWKCSFATENIGSRAYIKVAELVGYDDVRILHEGGTIHLTGWIGE